MCRREWLLGCGAVQQACVALQTYAGRTNRVGGLLCGVRACLSC